jgi:urease accessory protein
MKCTTPFKSALTTLVLLALSTAQAHDGHHHSLSFMTGLLHPFTGMDHLTAMLLVGVWSAVAMRPVWFAPLAFMALLMVGAVWGADGVSMPAVEPMVAVSLLVLGLLLWRAQKLSLVQTFGLIGGFAFFHGLAHGQELGGPNQWSALLGMLLGTAVLHLTGMLLGQRLWVQHRWLQRGTGLASAALGSLLLAGVL